MFRIVRCTRSGHYLSKLEVKEGLSRDEAMAYLDSPENITQGAEMSVDGGPMVFRPWFDVVEEEERPDRDFYEEATQDARDMATHFLDEIVEQLLDGGSATAELARYHHGDSHHHARHVDLTLGDDEARQILACRWFAREVATDAGLWDGVEPEEAVRIQAAQTYGNAVLSHWKDLVEHINEDEEVEALWSVHEQLSSLDESKFQDPNLDYYHPDNLGEDRFPKPYPDDAEDSEGVPAVVLWPAN